MQSRLRSTEERAVLVCETQETSVPALPDASASSADTKNNLGNLRQGSYCLAELAAGQRGLFFQVGGRKLEHRSPSASPCLA